MCKIKGYRIKDELINSQITTKKSNMLLPVLLGRKCKKIAVYGQPGQS
jgi:hypothetical protein